MPSFDFATEVPALLLRTDPNPFHHGTLGAVRSLGRAGVEVHVLADSADGPVSRSRFLHRTHVLPPYGRATDADLERALLRAAEAIGRPAVLMPFDDRGAIAVARLADRLGGRFLLPRVAPALPALLADKAELAGVCRGAGIAHPTTVAPATPGEAARAARALGLPAVAKWSRPWLLPPGMRGTTLVRTAAEGAQLHRCSAQAGSQLLLQRWLPGGHGTDWFFHGYAAEDGTLLTGGSGRKERSWPPRTGLTAVGTWLANPAVQEAAARIAARTGYRGVLDLDFRLDPATGAYHLLDFNPRPGAQFRLFTDEHGLDVVRAQHLHLTGRAVPATRGGPGRVFVAENYAALSALAALATRVPARTGTRAAARTRTRALAVEPVRPEPEPGPGGRRARSRGRQVERAWYAADDRAPFFAMARAWSARCARRAVPRAGQGLLFRLRSRLRVPSLTRAARARRAGFPDPAARRETLRAGAPHGRPAPPAASGAGAPVLGGDQ